MAAQKALRVTILVLVVYFIAVAQLAWMVDTELQDYARCCGLRGDYLRYYLPFPILTSSELSDIGGGPTHVNIVAVILNGILPILIGGTCFGLVRARSTVRENKPDTQ